MGRTTPGAGPEWSGAGPHRRSRPREAMLGFLSDLRATPRLGRGVRRAAIGVTDEHVAALRGHLLDAKEGHLLNALRLYRCPD